MNTQQFNEQSESIQQAVAGYGPVKVTLGDTGVFKSDEHDVVYISVLSNDLHNLRRKVEENVEHTKTHPNYIPHLTLAYVKPGLGEKYAKKLNTLKGREIEFDTLIFSDTNRNHSEISLVDNNNQFRETQTVDAYGTTPVKVHSGYGLSEAKQLLEGNKKLRGLHHSKTNKTYLWDASKAHHAEVAKRVGLKFNGSLQELNFDHATDGHKRLERHYQQNHPVRELAGAYEEQDKQHWERTGVATHPHLADSPHGMVDISKLKATHGRNQRPSKPIDHSAAYNPIVIDHKGEIQDGHHRYYDLKDKGYKGHVPVVVYGGHDHSKLGLKPIPSQHNEGGIPSNGEMFQYEERLNPHIMQRISTARHMEDIGSVEGILKHPKERKQFQAIRNVPIIVNHNLPAHEPAKAVHHKRTAEQKKAGWHTSTIHISPYATPEHIYHEMIHADRYAKGRVMENNPKWPHPEEHRALIGGAKLASRAKHGDDDHDDQYSEQPLTHSRDEVDSILRSDDLAKRKPVLKALFSHYTNSKEPPKGDFGNGIWSEIHEPQRHGPARIPFPHIGPLYHAHLKKHGKEHNSGLAKTGEEIQNSQHAEGGIPSNDDLKRHIQSGKKLDPLSIYHNGKEDGRHRAHAAKELGIKSVPVLIHPDPHSQHAEHDDILTQFLSNDLLKSIEETQQKILGLKDSALGLTELAQIAQAELDKLREPLHRDLVVIGYQGAISGQAEVVEQWEQLPQGYRIRTESKEVLPPPPSEQPKPAQSPLQPPQTPRKPLGALGGEVPPEIRLPDLEAAVSLLERSTAMVGHDYQETAELVKAGAFAITGDLDTRVVQEIKELLTTAVEEGQSQKQFIDEVNAKVFEAGDAPLSKSHLSNIFRTNALGAKSDAKLTTLNKPMVKSAFPYARVSVTHDERIRKTHKAIESMGLDNTGTYNIDDPFFLKYRGPWWFFCRCGFTGTTVEQASRDGVKEAIEWKQRAEETAKIEGGSYYQYLSQTKPLVFKYVEHKEFESEVPSFHSP